MTVILSVLVKNKRKNSEEFIDSNLCANHRLFLVKEPDSVAIEKAFARIKRSFSESLMRGCARE